MPLEYDTALTTFWFGVGFLNASLVRRNWNLWGVIVLWIIVFPMFQDVVREIGRHYLLRHPVAPWKLSAVTALPYLLAFGIIAWRWRHRHRPALRG